MLGIEGHHAPAGGAAGGLNPHTVLLGHRQEPPGILVPQIILADEGQLVKILDSMDIFGPYALFIHLFPIRRAMFIHMLNLLDELFALHLPNLGNRHGLRRFIEISHDDILSFFFGV